MQLYLACLLQYQSLPHTAIPFLKFIVLEKCCSSLILTFASKPVGGEKFLNCLKSTRNILAEFRAFLHHSSSTLFSQIQKNPPPPTPSHTHTLQPALLLKADMKEQKQRQKRGQHKDAEQLSCYLRRTRAPQGHGVSLVPWPGNVGPLAPIIDPSTNNQNY